MKTSINKSVRAIFLIGFLVLTALVAIGCERYSLTIQSDEHSVQEAVYLRDLSDRVVQMTMDTHQDSVTTYVYENAGGNDLDYGFVTDGEVSWVPEYISTSMSPIEASITHNSLTGSDEYGKPQRIPAYLILDEALYNGMSLSVTMAVYDMTGTKVDGRPEVFVKSTSDYQGNSIAAQHGTAQLMLNMFTSPVPEIEELSFDTYSGLKKLPYFVEAPERYTENISIEMEAGTRVLSMTDLMGSERAAQDDYSIVALVPGDAQASANVDFTDETLMVTPLQTGTYSVSLLIAGTDHTGWIADIQFVNTVPQNENGGNSGNDGNDENDGDGSSEESDTPEPTYHQGTSAGFADADTPNASHTIERLKNEDTERADYTFKSNTFEAWLAEQGERESSTILIQLGMTQDMKGASLSIDQDVIEMIRKQQVDLVITTVKGSVRIPFEALPGGETIDQVTIQIWTDEEAGQVLSERLPEGMSVLSTPITYSIQVYLPDASETDSVKQPLYAKRSLVMEGSLDDEKWSVIYMEGDQWVSIPAQIVEQDQQTIVTFHANGNGHYALVVTESETAAVQEHWASEPVQELSDRLLIQNVFTDDIEVNQSVNRGEFAGLLMQAFGLVSRESFETFPDIENQPFLDEINQAAEWKIVQGWDGQFHPDDAITREQMAVMMVQAIQVLELTPNAGEQIVPSFIDESDISPWAIEAVSFLRNIGIVIGNEQGAFEPKQSLTIAEAAVVISQLLATLSR
ncbi:S-layer homology domain-containing protein [Marinicrinis sediminis]|uniref:S-layer homology domain-containing protein n=1 Tax=Marinicrinis sediminis TaxID=1652465 RepID=A0ABW5R4U4_9BACL